MKYYIIFLSILLSAFFINNQKCFSTSSYSLYYGFNTPVNLYYINTQEDDFAPSYNAFENKLYFNSIINGYSKFFIASLNTNSDDSLNIFENVNLLKTPINETKSNNSYITFIDDKNSVLSAYHYTEYGNFLSLHKSNFERNTWSTPYLLKELYNNSFNAHPTISPNGKMMVFASNRDNNSTKKDLDLWLAYKQDDDTWGMIVPLDELNSTGDEITPYFASDNILIFASNGFYGPGNYDLYYTELNDDIWSNPLPLNDINTEFNESDPCVLPDGRLLFASDRPGGKGKLDIYLALPNTQHEQNIDNDILIITSPISEIDIIKNTKYNLVNQFIDIPKDLESIIEYEAIPSAIQISINFSKEFNVDSIYAVFWNYDTIKTDTNIILYELKNLEYLSAQDSVNVGVTAINKDGIQITNNLELLINIQNKKELIKYKSKNQEYYRIFAAFDANNIDNFYNINQDLITKINSLYSKNITAVIYNNDKLPQQKTSKIQKLFKNKQINFEYINSSEFNNNIIEFRIFI